MKGPHEARLKCTPRLNCLQQRLNCLQQRLSRLQKLKGEATKDVIFQVVIQATEACSPALCYGLILTLALSLTTALCLIMALHLTAASLIMALSLTMALLAELS